MNNSGKLKIIAEKNIIHDNLLDIMGSEFKFDHEKGLAEWLKNSADAYINAGVPDADQNIIIRFTQGINKNATIEFIDFVGMSQLDIEKAFKQWGDPNAAKKGGNKRVYGGHGNGGKFYMRQMFDTSNFVTYREGFLNIFGFNESKKYGFAEKYKNMRISPDRALKIAGINTIIFPKEIKKAILDGKTGFTVVRGIGPTGMKSKIRVDTLIKRFKNHPQSRRLMSRINVLVGQDNVKEYIKLEPDNVKPLNGFENPRIISIPRELSFMEDGNKVAIEMVNNKYPAGKLILKTSEEAFGKGGQSSDLNRIDIIGELGTIGSYQLFELGVKIFPQASFIYGECECPILEDPAMISVKNDRTKLQDNPRSKALLQWIRDEIDSVAGEIASKEKAEQDLDRKKISVAYNEYLNQWKDRFMVKILGDLFNKKGSLNDATGRDEGRRRKNLDLPETPLSFSFPLAKLIKDEVEDVTIKAIVPRPIPIGSILTLKSTNTNIELVQDEVTIKSDHIRIIHSGETVAVLNASVVGRKIGEEGKITVSVGKYFAEIDVQVIENVGKGKSKGSKTPKVLLSGTDPDPLGLDPNGTVILNERSPVVYQRPQDATEGIYWINTQSPIANAILKRDPDREHSIRWRDFLFQRYVDIFVKQALYELQKRDPEGFRADRIDSEIFDGLIQRIHAAALDELSGFFFDVEFDPISEGKKQK